MEGHPRADLEHAEETTYPIQTGNIKGSPEDTLQDMAVKKDIWAIHGHQDTPTKRTRWIVKKHLKPRPKATY